MNSFRTAMPLSLFRAEVDLPRDYSCNDFKIRENLVY
jgi:hypothetical protein